MLDLKWKYLLLIKLQENMRHSEQQENLVFAVLKVKILTRRKKDGCEWSSVTMLWDLEKNKLNIVALH